MTAETRLVLTGSSGFIGSHLFRDLMSQNVDLLLVTHENLPPALSRGRGVETVSVSESGWLEQVAAFEPTCFIHAATLFRVRHSAADISAMLRANVEIGTQLVDLAYSMDARFVTLSSAWQRYEGKDNRPVNLYAATKQAFDSIADFYRREGLDLARLFLFDVYGPGDTRQKLIPLLMSAAASGQPLNATSGNQIIDLTFVDDVVRAITNIALSDEGLPLVDCVVKSGTMTVRHVADVLSEVIGRPVPVAWGAVPDRPKEMLFEWKLEPVPQGWSPQVPLADGLKRTWNALSHGE